MTRGIWDRETVALLMLAAILPIAISWALAGGISAISRLLFFLVVCGIWQLIFMLSRAQPPSLSVLMTALAVAVLAPLELGGLQLLLGLSFGLVFGELAFGGWGRNVLNPATVTLAFLGFGFPAAPWPELPVQLAWAAVPALLIGTAFGVISWRLVLGAAATGFLALKLGLAPGDTLGAVLVVLALLVCDPVSSASTRTGQWMNGILYAGLVLLFQETWESAAAVQLAVSAALLTSIAAPLLDEIAIALWLAARRRRLG